MSDFENVSPVGVPPAMSVPPVLPSDSVGAAGHVQQTAERISREMQKAIVGQHELIEMLIVALLTGGHVLLEGVPGTAKTLAIRTLACILNVSFARIQFTPDLMPSDILGTNVFDPRSGQFNLKKGPIFAGLVLADEINRTPPKTQSALLEAMEERRVTIDGVSYELPFPFLVCATQNPIEFEGTYPLPEAQLDRFMLMVKIGYPSLEEEEEILARVLEGFRAQDLKTANITPILTAEELRQLRAEVERVRVEPAVRRYVVQVARATRDNRHTLLGASPRAVITLLTVARALAAIRGRDFATPDDVKDAAFPVLRHRLIVRPESELEGFTADRVLEAALQAVEVPR